MLFWFKNDFKTEKFATFVSNFINNFDNFNFNSNLKLTLSYIPLYYSDQLDVG